jgi:hypothetical protein
MDRIRKIRKTVALLFVAAMPAAAPPLPDAAPAICFTAGPVTYQLVGMAAAADFRVRIDNAAAQPALRIGLVDRPELADFALVDDVTAPAGHLCQTAAALKTVALVPADLPADITISLTPGASDPGLKLFVHSERVSPPEAAALYVLMRHQDAADKTLAAR